MDTFCPLTLTQKQEIKNILNSIFNKPLKQSSYRITNDI